jgi:hypothetical protein
MSPAERVAGAIAAGDISLREAESLLGFLALVDVVDDVTRWSRTSFWRRLRDARRLGLDVR